jgi:hypothetical protein
LGLSISSIKHQAPAAALLRIAFHPPKRKKGKAKKQKENDQGNKWGMGDGGKK